MQRQGHSIICTFHKSVCTHAAVRAQGNWLEKLQRRMPYSNVHLPIRGKDKLCRVQRPCWKINPQKVWIRRKCVCIFITGQKDYRLRLVDTSSLLYIALYKLTLIYCWGQVHFIFRGAAHNNCTSLKCQIQARCCDNWLHILIYKWMADLWLYLLDLSEFDSWLEPSRLRTLSFNIAVRRRTFYVSEKFTLHFAGSKQII